MTTTHPATSTVSDYFEEHHAPILEDFFTFLRFASVSSEPDYADDTAACAAWLKEQMEALNFSTQLWKTPGHPTLFGHYTVDATLPTLLVYNHYDVQPVDPIEEWTSPPFEPEVREGEVYARGAVDNKGQCFYVLQAFKALLKKEGSLPVNIKWVIEGEEEMGSAGLEAILDERKEQLAADYLVVVDAGIEKLDQPSVVLGARGITTFTVDVVGANGDLHSGSHGGMVMNPLHALTELLAGLRNSDGSIAIPGFYDAVTPLTDEERQTLAFDFDQKEYESTFATQAVGGEKKYSPLESAWIRPTLEINGIAGGYAGEGFKTVIPAKATAKISCRLVADQDPVDISKRVVDHLTAHAPEGVTVTVTPGHGGGAIRSAVNSPIVQAFAKAFSEVLQKTCTYRFEGGSIPIIPNLSKASGAETVLVGYCLPGDQLHAPNEHFGVERLKLGAMTFAAALSHLKEIH